MTSNTLRRYTQLRQFVKTSGARALWEYDLHWGDGNETDLRAFRFQVCLKNFDTPDDHR